MTTLTIANVNQLSLNDMIQKSVNKQTAHFFYLILTALG